MPEKKLPLNYPLVVLELRNRQDLAIFLDCFLIKHLFHALLLDMRFFIYKIFISFRQHTEHNGNHNLHYMR